MFQISNDGVEFRCRKSSRVESRHLLRWPAAQGFRVADLSYEPSRSHVLGRALGLGEIGTHLALAPTPDAVARQALDDEHRLPAPRRIVSRQRTIDRNLQ